MQWEYRNEFVICYLGSGDINELGKLGWELVCVNTFSPKSGTHNTDRVYIFKRPKK